jgi:hypothetical protein
MSDVDACKVDGHPNETDEENGSKSSWEDILALLLYSLKADKISING